MVTIHSLPMETLLDIFELVQSQPGKGYNSKVDVLNICLVCRRWALLGQRTLWRRVHLDGILQTKYWMMRAAATSFKTEEITLGHLTFEECPAFMDELLERLKGVNRLCLTMCDSPLMNFLRSPCLSSLKHLRVFGKIVNHPPSSSEQAPSFVLSTLDAWNADIEPEALVELISTSFKTLSVLHLKTTIIVNPNAETFPNLKRLYIDTSQHYLAFAPEPIIEVVKYAPQLRFLQLDLNSTHPFNEPIPVQGSRDRYLGKTILLNLISVLWHLSDVTIDVVILTQSVSVGRVARHLTEYHAGKGRKNEVKMAQKTRHHLLYLYLRH